MLTRMPSPSPTDHMLVPITDLPLEQNPVAVYLAHLQPGGRQTMRQALDTMAALLTGGRADALSCPWSYVRFQQTTAVQAPLLTRYRPATVNKMLSALRGVLQMAWRLGQMSADDYQRAADLGAVKGETLPAGRELPPGELGALLRVCAEDATLAGVRDSARLDLLYATGLRREEIVALEVEDYDQTIGRLVVCGKGRKERTAYVTGGAAAALADWLAARGPAAGALFWPVNKGGHGTARRMTAQAVYNVLQKRAGQAGVRACSPHDLRRTFVSDLLEAGADIATVAKMAGHANVQTTARYDRRPGEAKRKAAGLLHVPYRSREG